MTEDVFGTAALRHAVAEAWLGSATRFREDANSEEDHARGHYRDRVVVELLQNAADAAARAGARGHALVRLDLAERRLVVANTGAALDADGVASLASLRASAKSGAGLVGRFGVGFAAVRSVSDDVTVRSRSGGVRFSAAATSEVLAKLTAEDRPGAERLAADFADRGHDLPVLRLPVEAPALPADAEHDTVVEVALRDDAAVASVRAQLADVDDVLLLAFPAFDAVTVSVVGANSVDADQDTRRISGQSSRPQRTATGRFEEAEVADLPREHRRLDWSLTWALLPDGGTPDAPRRRVLHAPTPTDVGLDLPAVLLATFPVDAGRRHVLPCAATERLAAAAGREYAALLGDLAGDPAGAPGTDGAAGVLGLVPTGLPASELDAAIRSAAVDALRTTPLLDGGVAPVDALVITGAPGEDPELVAALAPVLPGIVAVPTGHQAVVRSLGATVASLADLVDDLPAGLSPARWHALLTALEPHAAEPGVLEALAGTRIPLADGRVAGVRGAVVLPESADDGDEASLAATARALGLRVVHPDAAHPLLLRAGAVATDPRRLLHDPEVRDVSLAAAEAVLEGGTDDGALELVSHALALVRLAGGTDVPFWTGELPVPTVDGETVSLRETVLPGTWAAELFTGLAPIAPEFVARYSAPVLAAAGARTEPAVYTVRDVVTPEADGSDGSGLEGPDAGSDADQDPDDPSGWLAGWSDYLRMLAGRCGAGVAVGDLVAVADLDAVGDEAWPSVLSRLSSDPDARHALLAPVRTGRASAPSYTAWWLRERFGAPFALHDGVPLLPPAPRDLAGLDVATRRALGGVEALTDLDAADWPAALDRLPAVGASLPLRDALVVWRGLARLSARLDPSDRSSALDPLPDRLPALDGSDVVVQRADDVEVAGTARWAALGAVLPAPAADAEALADLLDLPLAGEDGLPAPDMPGTERELDPRLAVLDHRMPTSWFEHERLSVAGRPVPWWVDATGRVHATSAAGLAAGIADVLGRPDRTVLLGAVLADPERAVALWVTTAWG
ncbi:histidine kinase/DNA gyrase B/HSP90-like ATPase [Isoptericola sp. CG 20/1183]|uniref:Histidine kinase/DNA gyrase B/HSP90-like ATPase n=1 Tax=Isoptericola halotolerans TaxID=300560 RepID=A0ABX5EFF2_9MICO|nr:MULTISPECIES: ATP-binding protein [Isoptericola]PRZ08122.1 histidine kinase/DNA gyrase B/HSP90-like ATPase [Isoptericola halotolerans]PRZ08919.1 histidine kinase/DNA gyrase B/HSP90-like ATPase [Isoptericola sp. CG 20/1183]